LHDLARFPNGLLAALHAKLPTLALRHFNDTLELMQLEKAMKLYEFAPTRSIRVRWTLQELGVDFEAITVNMLAGEHRSPGFLKINPAAIEARVAVERERMKALLVELIAEMRAEYADELERAVRSLSVEIGELRALLSEVRVAFADARAKGPIDLPRLRGLN
jgi:Glutathione S-transferase, N-terminal domain